MRSNVGSYLSFPPSICSTVKLCVLYRMTILPSVAELKVFLEKFKEFHVNFMSKYK